MPATSAINRPLLVEGTSLLAALPCRPGQITAGQQCVQVMTFPSVSATRRMFGMAPLQGHPPDAMSLTNSA